MKNSRSSLERSPERNATPKKAGAGDNNLSSENAPAFGVRGQSVSVDGAFETGRAQPLILRLSSHPKSGVAASLCHRTPKTLHQSGAKAIQIVFSAIILANLALQSLSAAAPAKANAALQRPAAPSYLSMPDKEAGPVPLLLSQTGAFKNTQDLTPVEALIPYDINVAFWSDGASKFRWMCLPNDASAPEAKIGFHPEGEWTFPSGTVFVKHFEIAVDETRPEIKRRLETRLLVRDSTGSVYGVTYKWRPDNSDAELLTTNLTEQILIKTATGTRTQTWYYPSRQDCRVCHTDKAGGVLGVKTRQMNVDFKLPNGSTENQLLAWNRLGLLDSNFREDDLPHYAALARADEPNHSLEQRARSYLDANCSHCHRPGGTVAYFDARYDTPVSRQSLVDGPVLIDQGIDRARVIAPADIWRSIALMRVNTLEAMKMPPLAHETLDQQGVTLLRQWIESLPGRKVLAPPTFSKPAGKYATTLEVALAHPEPGVSIRYTLDGSVPTPSDPLYEKPIKLNEATTVRAKAYKEGFTKSITVQATYLVGD